MSNLSLAHTTQLSDEDSSCNRWPLKIRGLNDLLITSESFQFLSEIALDVKGMRL